MTRAILGAGLIVWTSWGAFGQAVTARPEFEVASVKPSAPMTGGRMSIRMSTDPGRINYTNVSLKQILMRAYSVKEYQIAGPDWLNTARFDIAAKLPNGAPQDQVPLMLQALLESRFKMTLHRETKDLPVYALVVGKNGPKMRESTEDASGAAAGVVPLLTGSGGGGEGTVRFSVGGDGKSKVMDGGGGGAMVVFGRGHLAVPKVTVSAFAELLGHQVDRPVLDQTELKGKYDFSLDWTPDEGQAGMKMGEKSGDGTAVPVASTPDGPDIFAAVQAQLGLRLEPRKGPVEMLVIEHVEKAPTEN